MTLTKRIYQDKKKILIFGSGSSIALFVLLIALNNYGINVTTSGDIVCGEECISYFNISLSNYSVCFGSTFKGVYLDKNISYELYKADARYSVSNPLRWKLYNFTANKCLDKNKVHEFELVGHKLPSQTIKWGLDLQGKNLDPFWYSTGTENISIIYMELGSQVNITANITGQTSICVDIDHPSYGNNYSCGSPSANFLFNITYFRNNQFNDSSIIKNITWTNGGNQTFFITQHQYDEIINASINVTGYLINNTYPTNVKIYINNTLSNNLGLIYTGDIVENRFNDSLISKNFTFTQIQTLQGYFYIPKTSKVTNAVINLTGYLAVSDFEYNGNNYIYDEINDSSLNLSLWLPYAGSYSSYTETNDYLQSYSHTGGGPWAYGTSGYVKSKVFPDLSVVNITNITLRVSLSSVCTFGGSSLDICSSSLSMFGNTILTFAGTEGYSASDDSIWSLIKNGSNYDVYNTTAFIKQISVTNNEISILTSAYYGGGTCTQTADARIYYVYFTSTANNILNPSLDIGTTKSIHDWNFSGKFEISNLTSNLNQSVNDYLSSCAGDTNGYCTIPIYLTSYGLGIINAKNIIINYTSNPNPIYFDNNLVRSFLGNSSNFANIPIKFESTLNGTLGISDIRLDYAGGNDTINVLVYNTSNKAQNESLNLINYYSRYDYKFPKYISYLEFIPKSPTTKNVTPYGQNSLNPIFNLTMLNYGGKNMNFSVYLNETHSCVNLSISNQGNVNNLNYTGSNINAWKLNNTWQEAFTNKEYLNNSKLWMFADYSCNYTTWRLWQPDLYFKSCCVGCICSNDLI